MESENLGATATSDSTEVVENVEMDKQNQDLKVDANPSKTKDFGDVPLEPSEAIMSVSDNVARPGEPLRRANSNKLSKRKRKNRKRRIKNAVAAMTLENSVNDGDSVLERSQTSEDGKGEDTETDVEVETAKSSGGFEDIAEVPSITITTVEGKSSAASDIGIGTNSTPEMKNARTFTQEEQRCPTGTGLLEEPFVLKHEGYPTHSVSTLLQLAKQRVATGVLQSSIDSFLDEKYDFQSNSSSMFTVTEEIENEEQEQHFTAPPCSPSSIHNIVKAEESESGTSEYEKEKSATRTVHFDERPPEVMEAPSDRVLPPFPKLSGVEKLQAAVNELHQKRLGSSVRTSPSPSKETVVLVHNVPSASATSSIGSSSIASLESAASLLKGNSSCEDFVEPSIHLPSREAISEVPEAVITHNHSEICMREMNSYAFDEVEMFKLQNPEETMQLNSDLDSVILEAVDKLPEVSYLKEYRYSRDADGAHTVVNIPETDERTGSLAFGNPEVIFSIETKEFNEHVSTKNQNNNSDMLKLDINENSLGGPEEELCYSDVPLPLLEVISEAETDEIENFSRGSSLPGFAEETQDDFEETMMSEEQGSNETIVQANEGIANMISVETTMVHNPKNYGTVEEVTFSNSNSQKTQLPTFRTFYETDESELELTESVESVVLRPAHANQAEIVLSEAKSPAQALNIENSRSQSEVVLLDIDLSKPQESHACGDIPIQINLTENNNLVGSDVESEIDAQNQNSYTDTESDFQFLPQRTESLTKAIEQKERPTNGATGNQSAADENIEEVELDKQGCSCAKLCVIT